MKRNNIGVFATHNAPSELTREEKVLRNKRRALERELTHQRSRLLRFEGDAKTPNPVRRAAAEAECELARQRVSECEVALTELQSGMVN